MPSRRLLLYWLPPLAWMAAIFAGSSLTGTTVDRAAAPARIGPEVAHAVEYGVLALLLYRAFGSSGVKARWAIWAAVLLLTIAYAATDELHQSFVPGRDPSWQDLGYDSLGAFVGLPLAELTLALKRRAGRGK